ncbi:hypothetical protein [Erwinia sp. S38]|uniref:hypothetical protein n=1 Tax=Erwinia sp. S38 TaxID=2769338 RepID=UPI00190BA178|nr:hypothetical protein [Erwinia sp. S38]MBK0000213.1 hypothetical protein [Erwinia sp. S38]
MSNQIMELCKDTPEVGVLACFLYDEIECYAKKAPNMLLSYNDIFSITKKHYKAKAYKKVEEISINAVQVLCNPCIDFLKLKYYFIDDYNDPIEIDLKDVFEANFSKSIEHPYTGELVYDYKRYVFPFFTVDEFELGRS